MRDIVLYNIRYPSIGARAFCIVVCGTSFQLI